MYMSLKFTYFPLFCDRKQCEYLIIYAIYVLVSHHLKTYWVNVGHVDKIACADKWSVMDGSMLY